MTAMKHEGGSGFYVFYQYPAIECKLTMTLIEVQYVAIEGLIRKHGGTLFYSTLQKYPSIYMVTFYLHSKARLQQCYIMQYSELHVWFCEINTLMSYALLLCF